MIDKLLLNGYFMGTFATALIIIVAEAIVGTAWPVAIGCIIGVGIAVGMSD